MVELINRARANPSAEAARFGIDLSEGLRNGEVITTDPKQPLAINFNLKAEITYQNGFVRTWTFPRMEKLGYWERFQKERYRKWRERVRMDMYSMVWDDTARYVARLNDTPTNHPVQVSLIREWQPIPMPMNLPGKNEASDYQPMISGNPAFTFNYHFHFYNLRRDDL